MPKPTQKAKRKRTGGPAPFAEGREQLAELVKGPDKGKKRFGSAWKASQWGRFDDEGLQAVGYALGAIFEIRKRPDYIEPAAQSEGVFSFYSHAVKSAETLAEARVFEAKATAVLMQWLTESDKSDLETKLPEKLRVLANLLEARPLKPSPNSPQRVLQPSPADPSASAVFSLAFEASRSIPGDGSRSIEEIIGAIAAMPKEKRDACIERYFPRLEDRRIRRLIGSLFGIQGKPGRPKKSD